MLTTRWAMSYLRGPLTRDQISTLMAGRAESATPTPAAPAPAAPDAGAASVAPAPPVAAAAEPAATSAADESPVMPAVAQGIGVRYLSPSAPWAAAVGADPAGVRLQPAAIARVQLRFDDTKADLVHDEEWEAVLAPLTARADPSSATAVDYDDRDLVVAAPATGQYVLTDAPIGQKAFWNQLQKDLVDLLVRNQRMDLQANKQLKLWSRPGETPDQFAERCRQCADAEADKETAALRTKYEAKAKRLRDQLMGAQAKVDQYEADSRGARTDDLLSAAGGLLGSFLGGRSGTKSLARQLSRGSSSSRRRSSTGQRRDAANARVATLQSDAEELEADLADEIAAIDDAWTAKAAAVETVQIPLEKTDVAVTSLSLLWLPVPAGPA